MKSNSICKSENLCSGNSIRSIIIRYCNPEINWFLCINPTFSWIFRFGLKSSHGKEIFLCIQIEWTNSPDNRFLLINDWCILETQYWDYQRVMILPFNYIARFTFLYLCDLKKTNLNNDLYFRIFSSSRFYTQIVCKIFYSWDNAFLQFIYQRHFQRINVLIIFFLDSTVCCRNTADMIYWSPDNRR